jgi:transcriptional regulator with XRE-family HTH domain
MRKKAPSLIDLHVGKRVRMRRMMLNLSQAKLAEPLGLTFQQVQKYENGTNRIAPSRLQLIASTLQVPVAFFFEGAPGQGDKAAGYADPLLELAIPDEGVRAAILELVEALVVGAVDRLKAA